jgi:hypothetical protein
VTLTDYDDPSGRVIVAQNWAQLSNLPNTLAAKAWLQQGRTYHVMFTGNVDNGRLFVLEPTRDTFSLTSRDSSFIDYYVTWSGQDSVLQPLDSAVRGYRSITGDTPPYGLWAYGFWQCKEHYASQAELLNASITFRALGNLFYRDDSFCRQQPSSNSLLSGIPVDNIVQVAPQALPLLNQTQILFSFRTGATGAISAGVRSGTAACTPTRLA